MSSVATGTDLRGRMAVSAREAALAIGCSESTFRRYMAEEGLPYSRVNGRNYILIHKLERWLEAREEQPGQKLERVLSLVDQALRDVEGS